MVFRLIFVLTSQEDVDSVLGMKIPETVWAYIGAIRNHAKRRYAEEYLDYLAGNRAEPDSGTLSYMGAQAVRNRLRELLAG